jgi:hypothetical protein
VVVVEEEEEVEVEVEEEEVEVEVEAEIGVEVADLVLTFMTIGCGWEGRARCGREKGSHSRRHEQGHNAGSVAGGSVVDLAGEGDEAHTVAQHLIGERRCVAADHDLRTRSQLSEGTAGCIGEGRELFLLQQRLPRQSQLWALRLS